jgi:hypothetical protein
LIRTRDTIENPTAGERLRFLKTSGDTNGESVAVECTVQPDGFVAAAQGHPEQRPGGRDRLTFASTGGPAPAGPPDLRVREYDPCLELVSK